MITGNVGQYLFTANFSPTPLFMLFVLSTVLIAIMLSFALKTQSYSQLTSRVFVGVKRKFSPSLFTTSNSLSPEQIKREKMSQALTKVWDLKGLRDEVARLHMRAVKRMEKITSKPLQQQQQQPSEETKQASEPGKLEECVVLANRISSLQALEEVLKTVNSPNDHQFMELIPMFVDLEINDRPPERPKILPKKEKGTKPPPRKPYFVYKSIDDIEIFVGRSASDNDELSCNRELRDEDDWWLHVAGYPGSHVVIRCTDDNLPTQFPETLMDAVVLAAANSKFEPKNRVQVSLTRCRNVRKPSGAKPGLVNLVRLGDIRLIKVDLNSQSKRLERLQKIG